MTEQQFAYAVIAVVRVSAAVAMFDLFRRCRRPVTGILSAGLAAFATAPLLRFVFGAEAPELAIFVTQSFALVLLIAGVVQYFVTLSNRLVLTIATVASALSIVLSSLPVATLALQDSVFLLGVLVLAIMFVRFRDRFSKVAGNSYAWGLVICAVAALMLSLRLFGPDTDDMRIFEDFLSVTISGAIGLYMLNLEFNASYVQQSRTEMRYRTLFDTAGDAILVADMMGNILDGNALAAHRLGYTVDELRGLHLSQIDDEDSASKVVERLDRIRDQKRAVFESVQRRKNGELLPVEVSAVLIDWEGEPAILGNIRDLTERKQGEELVVRMAYYDSLTGLANRTLFNDRLTQALAHTRRTGEGLALFFIDLDNFKSVNDSMGHPVGDQLLAAVAQRLCGVVREDDTVARFGGDEYTLLLPQIATEEAATTVAWKLLETLQEPFGLADGIDFHVTASIGIAIADGSQEPADLIRNADIAMFRAKERGRNTYQFFDPAMNTTAIERFEIKNELRRAMDSDELELHYQPLVSVREGRIAGAEALLRWTSPTRGRVSPDVFIPLAEESGMIIPLGRRVLREACAALRDWHAAGFTDIRVSVNLSARQLLEDDVLGTVQELLAECEVDAACLELEVTESIAMHDQEAVNKAFSSLGETGIRIAIDDFGTGYSSLDRLKHLPINTLKIAQPFIADLEDRESAAIVTTIIVLGRSLGLNVVAEGVETPAQREFLDDMRCDEMQGFLYSPAVPKSEFEQMLRAERRQEAPPVATGAVPSPESTRTVYTYGDDDSAA